jgi:hypothetical protein
MRLLNGTGYTMHQGPDGFYLDIDFPDPIVTLHPFYVTLFKDAGANKFKVETGTVNSFTPTLDSTKLDVLPAPSKTISATGYVYLKCQYSASGAFPYTVTVEYGSTIPADEDEFAYVNIAAVNITSGVATKTAQSISTSLSAERLKCGTDTAEYFFSRA